jgi:hypothetical protein
VGSRVGRKSTSDKRGTDEVEWNWREGRRKVKSKRAVGLPGLATGSGCTEYFVGMPGGGWSVL